MRCRLSDLTESLLQQRTDLDLLSPATDGPNPVDGLEYFGGPEYFDDECIYDPVDDATALWLLGDWLDGEPDVGWRVHLELSKLLAKRWHLVLDRVEPIVRELAALRPGEGGFTPWARHQLCLSVLWRMQDGESLAVGLIERVPEDFRDGLLLACYKLNTPAVYEAVKAAVRRWEAEGCWCGGSTGELWQLRRMVERWDATFPGGDHEDVRRFLQQPA
jgi:hypothetical protein